MVFTYLFNDSLVWKNLMQFKVDWKLKSVLALTKIQAYLLERIDLMEMFWLNLGLVRVVSKLVKRELAMGVRARIKAVKFKFLALILSFAG